MECFTSHCQIHPLTHQHLHQLVTPCLGLSPGSFPLACKKYSSTSPVLENISPKTGFFLSVCPHLLSFPPLLAVSISPIFNYLSTPCNSWSIAFLYYVVIIYVLPTSSLSDQPAVKRPGLFIITLAEPNIMPSFLKTAFIVTSGNS